MLDHDALGDLQFQQAGWQSGLVQQRQQALDEVALAELPRADVHAQAEILDVDAALGEQLRAGAAGLLDDPLADLDDQPAVFQDADEAGRRLRAASRVAPAQ